MEPIEVVRFIGEVVSASALVGAVVFKLLRDQIMTHVNKELQQIVKTLSEKTEASLRDVVTKEDLETTEKHLDRIEQRIDRLTDHLIGRRIQ